MANTFKKLTALLIIAISITVLGALIAYWSQNEPNTLKEWRKSLTTSSFLKYIPILYIKNYLASNIQL